MKIQELLLPYQKDLEAVHGAVAEAVKAARIVHYGQLSEMDVLESNLRPALVFLCGCLCGQNAHSVMPLAKAVQFMFMAGVIHRQAVAQEIAGDNLKAHILLGDYFYSGSFRVLSEAGLQQLLVPLAKAVRAGCEAAVTMVDQERNGLDSEIAKKETALLISECCRLPGIMAKVEFLSELCDFGIKLGMAHFFVLHKGSVLDKMACLDAATAALLRLPAVPVRQSLGQLLDLIRQE